MANARRQHARNQGLGWSATGPGRRGFLVGMLPLLAAPAVIASRANAAGAKATLRYWSFLDPASDDPRSLAQAQMIDGFTVSTRTWPSRSKSCTGRRSFQLLQTGIVADQQDAADSWNHLANLQHLRR